MATTKPQGKGIVKALGQKSTTGNFKKINVKKSAERIKSNLNARGKAKKQVGF